MCVILFTVQVVRGVGSDQAIHGLFHGLGSWVRVSGGPWRVGWVRRSIWRSMI